MNIADESKMLTCPVSVQLSLKITFAGFCLLEKNLSAFTQNLIRIQVQYVAFLTENCTEMFSENVAAYKLFATRPHCVVCP